MVARKTERLMNLVIALLVSRQYLTKDRIRQVVEGYRDQSDEAFDRMFERDKDELREIGIVIETGTHDKLFDDEIGYRISRGEYELGDIDLTPEEAAVVGLAGRVWEHAGLAEDSGQALVKLKAAGIEVDDRVLGMVEPRLSANEPSFDAVWDAATRRVPITFQYQRPGQEPATRQVQPWGVLSWHGRWYLAGYDVDRAAPRVFRLTRVVGDVTRAGAPGSYEVPADLDLKALAHELFPAPAMEPARLRVRRGRGNSLRRTAEKTVRLDDEWDEVLVAYASPWELAAEAASFGPDVVVLEPAEVREQTVARLRAAAQEVRP